MAQDPHSNTGLQAKVRRMIIEWSDDYALGIDEIDKQHHGFFDAAHRLYYAVLNVEGEKVVEQLRRGYGGKGYDGMVLQPEELTTVEI